MADFGAISRTFSELSNLVMRQQEFNANLEDRRQKFALQSQLQTEQIKDQLIARRQQEIKLNEMERMSTPTQFSMYGLADRDSNVYKDPKALEEMRAILDPANQYNLTFSRADGMWKSEDGRNFMISPNKLGEMAPALTGIIDRRDDMVGRMTGKLLELQQERAEVVSGVKKNKLLTVKDQNRRRDLAEIDTEIAQVQGMLTPLGMVEHYRKLRERQGKRASWATSKGHTALAKYFMQAQAEAADLEKTALNKYLSEGGDKGQPVQRYAIQIKDGKMVEGSWRLLNVPKNIPNGMVPQTIDPNLRTADGWMWAQGVEAFSGGGGGASDKTQGQRVFNMLKAQFGDLDKTGQFVVTSKNQAVFNMATGYANKMMNEAMKKGTWRTDLDYQVVAATKARQKLNQAQAMYQQIQATTEMPMDKKKAYVKEMIEDLMTEFDINEQFARDALGIKNTK